MKPNLLVTLALFCLTLIPENLKAQQELNFIYNNIGEITSHKIFFNTPPEAEQLNDNNTNAFYEIFNDKLGKRDIVIYPNPTKGKLIIEIPGYKFAAKDKIDVITMQGTLLKRISPLNSRNIISLVDYPNATYLLLIQIDGQLTEWNIIKQ